MKRPACRLALGLLTLPLMALAAPAPSTHEFKLDNGLKIILREDHRAPVAAVQLWYKVGSSYEPPGASGLSHALEHLLFQGSSKLCPGQAFQVIGRLGGSANAYTNHDATVYEYLVPRHALGAALEILADQMTSAELSQAALDLEIEVINNERRQNVDDAPMALLDERLRSIAFASSGYRTATVGWPQDLARFDVHQLRDWYQRWYAPNNATLVVVGDITPLELLAQARRYFAGLPRRPLAASRRPLELGEPGERRLTLLTEAAFPRLVMAFNVPSLASAAEPRIAHSLRLLSELLGGGIGSRLSLQLRVHEQRVSRARSRYEAFNRGDALLTLVLDLDTRKKTDLASLEQRLWQLLGELKAAPVSAQELGRARTRLLARQVFARDSLMDQADKLGSLESSGLSWTLEAGEEQALAAVTPGDIQQVAHRYLTRERLSLAVALPRKAAHE